LAITAEDGSVSHDFWFNTYSGSGLTGDRCKATVKSLEVVVVHSDYRVRRLRFDVRGRLVRRDAKGFGYIVTLPRIELERLRD
jgi:hypothetical protein